MMRFVWYPKEKFIPFGIPMKYGISIWKKIFFLFHSFNECDLFECDLFYLFILKIFYEYITSYIEYRII